MELEFDKEIDSLLRKADRGVLVGDRPGEKPKVHLDADEISAFAENTLPQKARALHMAHLADCDHCRRVLSGLITLNAQAEPAEARVAAPAISPASIEPWYRRLLLPNLAYVMGGLVLVFGGLITFSLLQSSMGENAATISQSVEQETGRGPMESVFESQTANMANANASSVAAANSTANSANTMSNAAPANKAPSGSTVDPLKEADAGPVDDRAAITMDGVDAKPAVAAPAPVPPPMAKGEEKVVTTTVPETAREEAKARSVARKKDADGEKADMADGARQTQEVPRTQAGGVAKSTPGPSRDLSQNFPNRANNTFEMYEEKRVSGKSFQHRDNVWYDKAYRGQATTNVRRQTDEYRKLDTGLRTIAESLSGVVVVVWKDKAYRIQ